MRVALAFGLIVIASCNSSPPPPQNLPLAQCASGWWMDNQTTPCATYCYAGAPMPECAQADCIARAVSGFVSGSQLVGAVITYSATGSTLSSAGPPTSQGYDVTGTGIHLTPPDKTLTAACRTTDLNIGSTTYIRPSAGISTTLDKAAASGTSSRWTGFPVAK